MGIPRPQGSKRVFNGRVVEAAGQGLKVWRKAIAQACYNLHISEAPEFLTGPVRVEVDFYLPRPPSVKMTGKNGRALPIVPPDLDKLLRSTLDGIGQGHDTGKVGDGLIWGDDSQVVEIVAKKFYADDREPGADIRIIAL
jgi:Holliday junction resolvase RusA-like endonuclease